MSESSTVSPETTTETVVAKATVAERKALASAAFLPDADVATVAALFGNVPNGREYLDVAYSAAVTAVTLAAVAENRSAEIAAMLAPLATLREDVEKAMTAAGIKVSSVRTVDPVAVRAALVARFGELAAIGLHLEKASEWVKDLMSEIENDADLTSDELDDASRATVPESVTKLTDRLAAVIEKSTSTRAAATGDGTRATVDHSADAAKLTIGRVIAAKSDAALTCEIIGTVDAKGHGKGAFRVNGEKVDSISSAAKALAGGERNGWTYFDLS